MEDEREVHVEFAPTWDVVITDDNYSHGLGRNVRRWPHDSPAAAIQRADRMFAKKLATKRGKDVWVNRIAALEALWSAWKKVMDSGTGYDPAFTEAVERLRELERKA